MGINGAGSTCLASENGGSRTGCVWWDRDRSTKWRARSVAGDGTTPARCPSTTPSVRTHPLGDFSNFLNLARSKHIKLAMRAILVVFFLGVGLAAAVDPFVGTWKLDSDRSKFAAGDPSILLATIRIEPAENGIKSTASGADGEGLASDFTFKCRLDGTSCPVTTAMPNRSAFLVDTISLKRVDDRTMTAAGMKDGKLVYSDLRVVSLDGSTLTVTREGTTPEGKRYRSTIVLTRSH